MTKQQEDEIKNGGEEKEIRIWDRVYVAGKSQKNKREKDNKPYNTAVRKGLEGRNQSDESPRRAEL